MATRPAAAQPASSQPPLELTIWFDSDCPLCARVARWLDRQPQLVPLRCVAAQSAGARGCPLDLPTLLTQLTVTASDGAVYRGCNAWITALWALRDYRGWSLRFAQPAWRPLAERLFAGIAGVAAWTKWRGRAKAPKTRSMSRTAALGSAHGRLRTPEQR